MRLSARDLRGFVAKPDVQRAGILLHGPDAMRTALLREDLTKALIGPNGADEMRLTRMTGADARRDPAAVVDALKAVGFFPGQRAVLVEEAGDGVAPALKTALDEWRAGDAMLVVTAGQLTPRGALRKLFEGAPNALAAGIYPEPPSRDQIAEELRKAGLSVAREAMQDLEALALALDPGDFRQTLEKLSLYMASTDGPATSDDIAAVAPGAQDAGVDALVESTADGQVETVAALLPRLSGSAANPTSLCIALQRYYRQLHAAASAAGGPDQALARLRPPVFGPRRDRMARQARSWGADALERALALIHETDLTLRSASAAPPRAVVERLAIRLAISFHRR